MHKSKTREARKTIILKCIKMVSKNAIEPKWKWAIYTAHTPNFVDSFQFPIPCIRITPTSHSFPKVLCLNRLCAIGAVGYSLVRYLCVTKGITGTKLPKKHQDNRQMQKKQDKNTKWLRFFFWYLQILFGIFRFYFRFFSFFSVISGFY